jgi:20S proteasome alpha/beta subunit
MTLVIAAPGDDFIVVGADSRAAREDEAGNRIQLNEIEKLVPVTKHVAVLVFGDADEANHVLTNFNLRKKKTLDGVTEVADTLAETGRAELRKIENLHVGRNPKYGFIIAGFDRLFGHLVLPRLCRITSDAKFSLGTCRPYAISGKQMIAEYMFIREYENAKKSPDALVKLVAQSIYNTMAIDGDVGGRINIGIIDSGGFRPQSDSDIQAMIETWSEPYMIRATAETQTTVETETIEETQSGSVSVVAQSRSKRKKK